MGDVVTTLSIGVSDEDINEYHTYSIIGGSGQTYFNLDPLTNVLTLAVNYDLEGGYAGFETLDIIVYDKYGLNDTGTLNITFTDVNDNTPIYNPTSYIAYVDLYTGLLTTFVTVAATDADIDTTLNANFTYLVSNFTYLGAQYFGFSGNILQLDHPIDVDYTTAWTFEITAVDMGNPQLTGTATVTVSATGISTLAPGMTTTAEQPGFDWWENPENIAAFATSMFVLAGLLGLMAYCCWRWHTFGRMLPRPRKARRWRPREHNEKRYPRDHEPRREKHHEIERGNSRNEYNREKPERTRTPPRAASVAPSDIDVRSVTPRNVPPSRTSMMTPMFNKWEPATGRYGGGH